MAISFLHLVIQYVLEDITGTPQSNVIHCTICPRGTYRRTPDIDTSCTQCPDGQTSLEGSEHCVTVSRNT